MLYIPSQNKLGKFDDEALFPDHFCLLSWNKIYNYKLPNEKYFYCDDEEGTIFLDVIKHLMFLPTFIRYESIATQFLFQKMI